MFRGDLFRSDLSHYYQSNYKFLCTMLRGVLRESAQAGSSAEEGVGSLRCRASGALYALLMTHPVDERGRCRACRRPRRVLMLPRQRCRVQGEASYWLRQPEWFLYFRVDGEWGLGQQAPPDASTAPGEHASPDRPGRHRRRAQGRREAGRRAYSGTSDPERREPVGGSGVLVMGSPG
ncbi:MAG: hypothetical protein WCF33_20850 [Pseudonocardiaceae bacterium]